MNNISYTFIIPHHNSPELLNRCLDSIPEREDIQIIVVDDNSRQDARPCINRSDVEIIYIDAAKTKGAGRARNVGLKKAKGKWVLFADCDDYYSPNFIDVLDEYKNQGIDVLYFNYNYIDETTNQLLDDNKRQKLLCSDNLTCENIEYIKYKNYAPWTKMVKREYIEKHKMYFEEVPNGNDILFALFIASYTDKIAISKIRLYNYIKTPNSIGTKKQTTDECLCRIKHRIKIRAYFDSINHPEWKPGLFLNMGWLLKNDIKVIFKILFHFPKMICNKQLEMEWIQILENHKKISFIKRNCASV